MASDPIVLLHALEFRHRDADAFVLRVSHLALRPGERVACVGPSGSGKTTLLHLISGVTSPSAGSVQVLGDHIESWSDHARRALRLRRIGIVFQELELIDYLSTLDNLLLPVRLGFGHPNPSHRDRAVHLARSMGIEHLLHRTPRRLSQGERQRAALCRALILSPPLVLCDEPTGNLDPVHSQRVLDLLLDHVASTGSTLFMVTHNHALLHRFDRVIDMPSLSTPRPARYGDLP